jgi:hypothetical protein
VEQGERAPEGCRAVGEAERGVSPGASFGGAPAEAIRAGSRRGTGHTPLRRGCRPPRSPPGSPASPQLPPARRVLQVGEISRIRRTVSVSRLNWSWSVAMDARSRTAPGSSRSYSVPVTVSAPLDPPVGVRSSLRVQAVVTYERSQGRQRDPREAVFCSRERPVHKASPFLTLRSTRASRHRS